MFDPQLRNGMEFIGERIKKANHDISIILLATTIYNSWGGNKYDDKNLNGTLKDTEEKMAQAITLARNIYKNKL